MEILSFEEFSKLNETQQIDEGKISNYFKYLFYYKDNYVNKYFGKVDFEKHFVNLNHKDAKFYKENILMELFLYFFKNERFLVTFVSSSSSLPTKDDCDLFKFNIHLTYAISETEKKTFRIEGNFRQIRGLYLEYEMWIETDKSSEFYEETSDKILLDDWDTPKDKIIQLENLILSHIIEKTDKLIKKLEDKYQGVVV